MLWKESEVRRSSAGSAHALCLKVSNSALSFGIFLDVVYHFTHLGKDFSPESESTGALNFFQDISGSHG